MRIRIQHDVNVSGSLTLKIKEPEKKNKGTIILELSFPNKPKIKGVIMALTMTDTQKVTGTLNVVDKHGHPSSVQAGSVSVSVDDSNIASVNQNPSGSNELEFEVLGVAPGVTTLHVSADADLGDGVSTISSDIAVEITAGMATGFGVTFGTPVEQ